MSASFTASAASRAEAAVGTRYNMTAELATMLGCPEEPSFSLSGDELLKLFVQAGLIEEVAPKATLSVAVRRWQKAEKRAVSLRRELSSDDWEKYELHKYPTELCVRWDYDYISEEWRDTETLIKMCAAGSAPPGRAIPEHPHLLCRAASSRCRPIDCSRRFATARALAGRESRSRTVRCASASA